MISAPTIHSNGTSRDELLRNLTDAIAALQTAIQEVGRTCPHGRDYYPQGEDAIREALARHDRRMRDLRAIQRELNEIAEATVGEA